MSNTVDLSNLTFEMPQDFTPISPGTHMATCMGGELTVSKSSGAPMVVLDWTVSETNADGEPDADAGKSRKTYLVITFPSKTGGKPRLNPTLITLFMGTGLWSKSLTERQKFFSNMNKAVAELLAAVDGATARIEVRHSQGNPRTDDMGRPIIGADGEPECYTNVDIDIKKVFPKKVKKVSLA